MCEFLLLPFVEYEIRFGTISSKFDSCVDKRYFEKIKQVLGTGSWENVINTKTTDYTKDSLRMSNQSVILKENVIKKDLSLDGPFDIRLSINQEFKLNSYINSFDKTDCVIREKDRVSFTNPNFKYDLTTVVQKKNGISTTFYEIEFEILVTPETLTWNQNYLNDFIECKVYDIINIVEPMEREKFKINLL
jgi:hypothetical protein